MFAGPFLSPSLLHPTCCTESAIISSTKAARLALSSHHSRLPTCSRTSSASPSQALPSPAPSSLARQQDASSARPGRRFLPALAEQEETHPGALHQDPYNLSGWPREGQCRNEAGSERCEPAVSQCPQATPSPRERTTFRLFCMPPCTSRGVYSAGCWGRRWGSNDVGDKPCWRARPRLSRSAAR